MSLTTRGIERQLKKIIRCCENNKCRLDIIDGQLVLVDTRIDNLEADVLDHETRITAIEGASGGTTINVVANYSALPNPTTVTGEFYYTEASQGIAWLPGNLGGTYRKAGLYYSNGVTWLTDVNPWEAAQADVDAGIITDQFVSPATLKSNLTNTRLDQFGITLDGGGASITTGIKGRIVVPYAGTITGWTILEVSDVPVTSSIVVDVKIGTYANYDTTPTFTTIAGTEKPTITTDVKGQDLTLTTWTTAVAVGDIFEFTVDSVTDAEKVLLLIHTTRT